VPLLYSGQELPNYKRLPFFEKGAIDWNEKYELHSFYKSLFGLKKSHGALASDASLQVISASDNVLVFTRKQGVNEVACVLNFSDSEKNVQIENVIAATDRNVLLGAEVTIGADGVAQVPPWSFAVLGS
jgi:glycosidase